MEGNESSETQTCTYLLYIISTKIKDIEYYETTEFLKRPILSDGKGLERSGIFNGSQVGKLYGKNVFSYLTPQRWGVSRSYRWNFRCVFWL